jgi:hypothetical protein
MSVSFLATELRKGESKDDDDSDSSTTEDSDSVYDRVRLFKAKNTAQQQIAYWWYTPYLYRIDTIVESVYIPTFAVPLMPYIEISMSSAFF